MNKKSDKTTGISPTTYHSLLKDISQIYDSALSDGNENWNKATLFSNWKIGERIVKIEQGKKERAGYGDRILLQLSKDLNQKYGKGFSDRNLRYMRKFYQLYRLQSIRSELSWTHYRTLLLLENSGERNALEKSAIRNGWSSTEILKQVNKVLVRKKPSHRFTDQEESINYGLKRPLLGLFTYRVLQNFSPDLERGVPNLDLGFSVKIENAIGDTHKLKVGEIVRIAKNGKDYSFESGANFKELYTYKAYLEKVVDGDTLVVDIDLGFKIFIRQRLRLRGLDAPEMGTRQGAIAKKFVESRLKDVKFLIIKTHGSDKYDRYLVDVFYLKDEADEGKVLTGGNFLNNEMIDAIGIKA